MEKDHERGFRRGLRVFITILLASVILGVAAGMLTKGIFYVFFAS